MQWGGVEFPTEDGSLVKLRAKGREQGLRKVLWRKGKFACFWGKGREVADIRGR